MLPTLEIRSTNLHESPARKKDAPYFLRHFRGELSFGVSFWVNYVGGTIFFALVGKLLVFFKDDLSLVTISYLSPSFSLLAAFVIGWLMVGTWRSASRYVASGGTRFCSLPVKALILVGAYYLAKLAILTISMLGVYGEIITGDKDIPAYDIHVNSDGAAIQFHGGLRAGAESEFKRKLELSSRIRLLEIDSDGGRLREGMRIARMVRARGLATLVSTHCESAATFLFIGGKERIVTPKAKIGFHRPSGIGGTGDDDYVNVRNFMRQAGITEEFIDRVLSTNPDDMWYPTYEEMKKAGVVTGILVDEKIRR